MTDFVITSEAVSYSPQYVAYSRDGSKGFAVSAAGTTDASVITVTDGVMTVTPFTLQNASIVTNPLVFTNASGSVVMVETSTTTYDVYDWDGTTYVYTSTETVTASTQFVAISADGLRFASSVAAASTFTSWSRAASGSAFTSAGSTAVAAISGLAISDDNTVLTTGTTNPSNRYGLNGNIFNSVLDSVTWGVNTVAQGSLTLSSQAVYAAHMVSSANAAQVMFRSGSTWSAVTPDVSFPAAIGRCAFSSDETLLALVCAPPSSGARYGVTVALYSLSGANATYLQSMFIPGLLGPQTIQAVCVSPDAPSAVTVDTVNQAIGLTYPVLPIPTVPDATGRTQAQAVAGLEDAGYQVVVTNDPGGSPLGTVTSQIPVGGSELPTGDTVVIWVATNAPSGGGGGSSVGQVVRNGIV